MKPPLVVRGAFDTTTCSELRAAMERAPSTKSTVARSYDVVDESLRRTSRARVEPEVVRRALSLIDAHRDAAARHFAREVDRTEEPQFLVYDVGGFFKPHLDTTDSLDAPEHVRARRISVVVFLDRLHEGGDLVLYGLFDDPRARDVGVPFPAEEGTLVAFPADLLHEVQPVTRGRRTTIATWFSR